MRYQECSLPVRIYRRLRYQPVCIIKALYYTLKAYPAYFKGETINPKLIYMVMSADWYIKAQYTFTHEEIFRRVEWMIYLIDFALRHNDIEWANKLLKEYKAEDRKYITFMEAMQYMLQGAMVGVMVNGVFEGYYTTKSIKHSIPIEYINNGKWYLYDYKK